MTFRLSSPDRHDLKNEPAPPVVPDFKFPHVPLVIAPEYFMSAACQTLLDSVEELYVATHEQIQSVRECMIRELLTFADEKLEVYVRMGMDIKCQCGYPDQPASSVREQLRNAIRVWQNDSDHYEMDRIANKLFPCATFDTFTAIKAKQQAKGLELVHPTIEAILRHRRISPLITPDCLFRLRCLPMEAVFPVSSCQRVLPKSVLFTALTKQWLDLFEFRDDDSHPHAYVPTVNVGERFFTTIAQDATEMAYDRTEFHGIEKELPSDIERCDVLDVFEGGDVTVPVDYIKTADDVARRIVFWACVYSNGYVIAVPQLVDHTAVGGKRKSPSHNVSSYMPSPVKRPMRFKSYLQRKGRVAATCPVTIDAASVVIVAAAK